MKTQITSYEQFFSRASQAKQAGKRFTPVTLTVAGDTITTVVAYQALTRNRGKPSALLESVLQTRDSGRYSVIGVEPFLRFTSRGFTSTAKSHRAPAEQSTNPLKQLKQLLGRYSPYRSPEDPSYVGGAIGYLGHEAITLLEPTVSRAAVDDVNLPDICLDFYRDVVVFDRHYGKIFILSNVDLESAGLRVAYETGVAVCKGMQTTMLAQAVNVSPDFNIATGEITATHTREQFMEMVTTSKEHIRVGDVFQVVLSQRFETSFHGSPLDFYRVLRIANPSPYMFHINLGAQNKTSLVGASPEVMVRIYDGKILLRPLAGTIQKGRSDEEVRNARKLAKNPKERAEHAMLVDLGRNDISWSCEHDSVQETGVMRVEPYGNLFHMVSDITGRLKEGVSPFEVALRCLPAGTLSGAPKIRALQIIAELEGRCRGPYGGAVGWFTDECTDSCIMIRSAVIDQAQGNIRWQTGAGIVADSDPEAEYQETLAKGRLIDRLLRSYQHA